MGAARCPAFFVVSNPSCRRGFLLSLDNLLDLNLHLMFFVLRNASLHSTWLLQRSVTVCCPFCCSCVTSFHTSSVLCCCSSSYFLTICTWFSQLDCFLLLNFDLRSNLNKVFSSFLDNLVLLPCDDDFQYLVSRHGSNFFLRDIVFFVRLGLQLALLFSSAVGCALPPAIGCALLPAVGCALLPAVGCALLPAVGCALPPAVGCAPLPAVGCALLPLCSVLVDLPLVVVQVLRLCAPLRQSGVASFVHFSSSLAVMLSLFSVFWRRFLQLYLVVVHCSEVRLIHLRRHYSACATS